jgi:GT2 family glycosyltransferase
MIRFSIVIPTYRRSGPLARCLAAVAALDYPREAVEVLVVDDGGASPELADVATPKVRLLRQEHAGPAAARNRGAEEAQGELLAFLDDDCEPAADWLRALEAALRAHPDALIGGRVVNALPRNVFSSASHTLTEYLYAYYNPVPQAARFFTSNNMAFRREAFLTVGGFDARYLRAAAEDRELCDRWASLGRPLVFRPEAVVAHAHELSPLAFWRQHLAYGAGAFHFHAARSRRNAVPIRIYPPSFYLRLLAYPFSRARLPRACALAGILAISQVANAAGFFRERRQARSR